MLYGTFHEMLDNLTKFCFKGLDINFNYHTLHINNIIFIIIKVIANNLLNKFVKKNYITIYIY